jgi:hypothetical protein
MVENFLGRSFEGQNLAGANFSYMNLSGANFSHADIRGVKFTGTILKNANFSYAKAGLQDHWIILLIVVGLMLSVLSGAAAGVAGLVAAGMLHPYFIAFEEYKIISGLIVLVAFTVFLIFTIQRGFLFGLVTMAAVLGILSSVLGTLFISLSKTIQRQR